MEKLREKWNDLVKVTEVLWTIILLFLNTCYLPWFFLREINSFTSATDQVPDGKNFQSLPPRAIFKPMKGLYLIISPILPHGTALFK